MIVIPPSTLLDPFYRPLHRVLIFLIGACLGSFFNVCIYRIPQGLSLSFPGSHCYRCGQPVRWFDNIPLFSYWILRGHCRHCGASFSIRYFVVELLTALLFLYCFENIGYSLTLLPALILLSLLIVATFTDLDHWIIPDRISLGGLAAGLLLAAIWPVGLAARNPLAMTTFAAIPRHWLPLVNAAAGALLGLAVMWGIGAVGSVVFRKEAMGWGDIKLFAMFGAFCGPEELLYILPLACVFGTVAGMGGLLWGRLAARRAPLASIAPLAPGGEGLAETLTGQYPLSEVERRVILRALTRPGQTGPARHHLPFGPSLALAAMIVYWWGPHISQWVAVHLFLEMPGGFGG